LDANWASRWFLQTPAGCGKPKLAPWSRSCAFSRGSREHPGVFLLESRLPGAAFCCDWRNRSSSQGRKSGDKPESHLVEPGCVDVSRSSGVQTETLSFRAGKCQRHSNGLRPGVQAQGKCPVFPSIQRKLGTTCPRLLQCIRDPSQPSSAVELANLAAHA